MNHVLNRSRSGGSFGRLHRCSSGWLPKSCDSVAQKIRALRGKAVSPLRGCALRHASHPAKISRRAICSYLWGRLLFFWGSDGSGKIKPFCVRKRLRWRKRLRLGGDAEGGKKLTSV